MHVLDLSSLDTKGSLDPDLPFTWDIKFLLLALSSNYYILSFGRIVSQGYIDRIEKKIQIETGSLLLGHTAFRAPCINTYIFNISYNYLLNNTIILHLLVKVLIC